MIIYIRFLNRNPSCITKSVLSVNLQMYYIHSAADPGFPLGGGANLSGWAPTYDFDKISKKLHRIEKILGRTGRPPLRSPLTFYHIHPISVHPLCVFDNSGISYCYTGSIISYRRYQSPESVNHIFFQCLRKKSMKLNPQCQSN